MKRLHHLLWSLLIFVMLGIGVLFLWSQRLNHLPTEEGSTSPLLIYKQLPTFSLTTQTNQDLSLADLQGKVWIADFIFTRCQSACPVLSRRMEGLTKSLTHDDLRYVSFSVDPTWDKPEVLAKYGAQFNAKESQWFFLTGEQSTIYDLVQKGFQLGVAEATPEELEAGGMPILHSSKFVLVDQEGRIRGYYDSTDESKMTALKKDALALLELTP